MYQDGESRDFHRGYVKGIAKGRSLERKFCLLILFCGIALAGIIKIVVSIVSGLIRWFN